MVERLASPAGAAAGGVPRADRVRGSTRFQPWPFVLAGVILVPALIVGDAPWWLVALVLVWSVTAAAVTVFDVLGRLDRAARVMAGEWLLAGSVAVLVVVLVVGSGLGPGGRLLFVAALTCGLAAVGSPPRRWLLQGVVFAALAVGLRGEPALDIAFVVVLVAGVAVIANLFTAELLRARRAEAVERDAAERRTALLDGVTRLPGRTVAEAAEAVTVMLRDLAFDGAGVFEARDGRLYTLHLDRLGNRDRAVPKGSGLSWVALERGETVVAADYQRHPRHLDDRPEIGSMVTAPVVVEGKPVAVVMGVRSAVGELSAAEIEIAEVLAAHLAQVMLAERHLQRQHELLARMKRLDDMRSRLMTAVTGELAEPLGRIRGAAAVLRDDTTAGAPVARRRELGRLCAEADELRRVVDTVLDFSGFHLRRSAPQVQALSVRALLDPLVVDGAITLAGDVDQAAADRRVVVDPELVRPGLRLLFEPFVTHGGQREVSALAAHATVDGVVVGAVEARSRPHPALVRSLAAQLLVAGGAEVLEGDLLEVLLPVPPDPAGVSRAGHVRSLAVDRDLPTATNGAGWPSA